MLILSNEEISRLLTMQDVMAALELQFAAAGALLLRKAREQGAGRDLPDDWFTEDVHP